MGKTTYKVTFECDCGENWGDCGKRSFFLLDYNRVVDIGTLYYKHHADDLEAKLENLGSHTDRGLAALVKVLTQADPDEFLSEEEKRELNSR